ncbi:aminotransferase class I/II-fold pyridoxal phosphate-dependent enzyme [Ligilactobacillus sp. Marseille-Q7487]|uniref:MalY/PatB family protein n=1 Tax=Ligilactobacillus sp. Marseille-Q7487 TaxID=3022128 RepID=UPI0024A7CE42|nr:aminotransferase class I/II-fold pyridoxal phosphate-dependent enzyme [Ligilactobacillus sp. Marseille-Q7487]
MEYNFNEINNRLGTYCTQWDYIEDRFHKKDLLPFSISDTDFIVPYPVTKKIHELADKQIYGYTRWNHTDFKHSITDYLVKRFNTKSNADWVVYSPSVMYSVSVLIRLLSEENQGVLTLSPMYDSFFTVIEGNKRKLVSSELINNNGKFEINFVDLANKAEKCEILLLCSPHNPTGRIWTKDELEKIISICREHNVKIISDEIHMDIQIGNNKHIPILNFYSEYPDIYLVSSSSKTFNTPGLIGSYALLPNEKIYEQFLYQTRKVDFLNSASIFGMYATMISYNDCSDYVEQLNEYIRGNMYLVEDFIQENLSDFKFRVPDGTYLAWIDVRDVPYTSDDIQKALVDVGGVGIMPGETYGSQKYLRMNVGCPQKKVMEGLKRVKKAMNYLYQK